MGPELEYIKGQTPIDEGEKEELKIKTISTWGELDEFEQANVEIAVEWSLKTNPTYEKILTVGFLKEVHRRMFSEVWGWAGKFRKTNKNIGVDKYQIELELTKLSEDCAFWVANKTYSEDEIALRFKHRLVKIHPFPNGNGRHSRLCADILISKGFKKEIFTWGSKNLAAQSKTRRIYLNAIYEADNGNVKPLLEFART